MRIVFLTVNHRLHMNSDDILQLAAKIGSGEYDDFELDYFLDYIKTAKSEQLHIVLEAYKSGLDKRKEYSLKTSPDFIERLKSVLSELQEDTPLPVIQESVVKRHLHKRLWIGWTTAAALMLILSLTFFLKKDKTAKTTAVAIITNDIKAPKSSRATITLSGGKIIDLDSAGNGTIAAEGNVKVRKLANGQIAYTGEAAALSYNTLTNPMGSRPVDMILSDGSRIWLNAGSSVTYPVAFIGTERNVQITGEAYFEVTHDARMPFTVTRTADDTKIQVLGTHFNINAYDDEVSVKITLLQGAVKVSRAGKLVLLAPKQQAELRDGKIRIVTNVDTSEVMAWKNGKFQFGDATDIASIMRQLSRWYDVTIEFQGNVTGNIGGSISRDVNVSKVLKMLQTTGAIKYKIENKKVTIMPGSP